MAFLPNIPQSTDQLSVSQGDILNNFTVLGAIAGNTNPASASLNTVSGFNWVYLSPQGATPPPGSSIPANNVAMYSATNPTTAKNELYVTKQNGATTVQIPMTASQLSVSNPTPSTPSWTYLPSGMLLKTGVADGPLSGFKQVTPNQGPAFTQIVHVVVCPYYPSGSTSVDYDFSVRMTGIIASTSFGIYISKRTTLGPATGTTGYQYFAIGY